MKSNFTREELEQRVKQVWWWKTAAIAATIVAVGISIAAICFGYWGWTGFNNFNQPTSIYVSQFLPPTPYPFYIEGSGMVLVLTLPSDLSAYRGNIYRIYSNTAQSHIVQIASGGAKFDGITTTATFGGQIGDGFDFELITSKFVNVKFVKNVIFS
jgi:hypothetical protein